MDDARLKEPSGWDYFDELLRRIRDIRASEKRFYQKLRDLFALSVDYKDVPDVTGQFFAVTRKTAAEIIVERADAQQPNMALTNWKAERVRKGDVIVAKNYLVAEEIEQLNRIVTLFMDFAEMRASQRKNLRMADWRACVDSFMEFNEHSVLKGAGQMSHDEMVKIAHAQYEDFNTKRRSAEVRQADADDLRELKQTERQLMRKPGALDAS